MSNNRNAKILCFFIGLSSTSVHADGNIVPVGVAPHGGYVILGGTVIPLKEVTLAAQMPGRVESIAGEEGDEFTAGTVLVTTDDDDLQAKKQAATAKSMILQKSKGASEQILLTIKSCAKSSHTRTSLKTAGRLLKRWAARPMSSCQVSVLAKLAN